MRSSCTRCVSCMALSCPAKPMGMPIKTCGGGGVDVAVMGEAEERFSGDDKRMGMLGSGVSTEVVEAVDIVSW
jgi:hypothetical protein